MANTTDRQRLAAALPFSDATLQSSLAADAETVSARAAPASTRAAADESITINPISVDNAIDYFEHANATVVSGYVRDGNPGDTVTVTLHGKEYSGTLGNDAMWYVNVPQSDIAKIPNGKVTVNASHTDSAGIAHQASSEITLQAGAAKPTGPVLMLNKVTGDDVLSAVERGGELLISGWGRNINEGYEVTVTLNGHQYHATTTKDSRWTITIPQQDMQALPEGQITLLASLGHGGRVSEVAKTLTLNNDGAGKASPSLSIDTVSSDDTISLYEIGAATFITGHATHIPAGSRVKLTISDKVFYGQVTDDGVWSAKVGQLFNAKNATSTHAVVSWHDAAGNEVAASREIHLVPTSYPYKYPLSFEIDTISIDGRLSGDETQNDLIITGSKFSGESLGVGETVYVTLNGKTYSGVVQGGDHNNHWQVTVPAGDVQALSSGSYTVVASLDATLNTGERVNSTQAKTFNVIDPNFAFNPISGDNVVSGNEHGNATVISGYLHQGEPGDTVLITLNGKTYSGTLGNDAIWSVSVPESDIAAIPNGKVNVSGEYIDSAGVEHHANTEFSLINSSSKVPTLFVHKITGDDVVSAVERGGDLLVSGSGRFISAGYEVQVTLNGHTYSTKTTTDSRWVLTIPHADLQGLPPEGHVTLVASLLSGKSVVQVAKTLTLNTHGDGSDAPLLSMDPFLGDDDVNYYEIAADQYVTGHAAHIAAGSTVKLVVGDQTYKGIVTSDGLWSVHVGGLFSLANGNTTHATVSYQDHEGNQFADARQISLSGIGYPYRYPMSFAFDPISGDGHLSGDEKQQDLIISSSRSSGEGLGIGATIEVQLNGKTYTTISEAGPNQDGYDNHWQVIIPASEVATLAPGTYTVIAMETYNFSAGGRPQTARDVEAKIITVDEDGVATLSSVASVPVASHADAEAASHSAAAEAASLNAASLGLHDNHQPSLSALVDRFAATGEPQAKAVQPETGAETTAHGGEAALSPAPADMWHSVTAAGHLAAQGDDAAHYAPATENALAELLQQQHVQPVA